MTYLIVLALVVLVFQIGIFIYLRRKNKKMKEEDVLYKYNIRSRADAWRTLADPDLPENDREKIREIYEDNGI